MLAILHICTALRYKPTSTASVSFIYRCVQLLHENRNISAYDFIQISTKRVVAPSLYD